MNARKQKFDFIFGVAVLGRQCSGGDGWGKPTFWRRVRAMRCGDERMIARVYCFRKKRTWHLCDRPNPLGSGRRVQETAGRGEKRRRNMHTVRSPHPFEAETAESAPIR